MDAYIIESRRTPIGRSHPEKGIFKDLRADELLCALMKNMNEVLDAKFLDDIFIGCVGQHLEQGKNIARLSALLAGYPAAVPAVTINRLCASSLQALVSGSLTVEAGLGKVVLAGGVEHMHHVPMTQCLDYHPQLLQSFEFPFTHMGLTAEKVATTFDISRESQDHYALESHRKAVTAIESGYFSAEIFPVDLPDNTTVDRDQSPRKGTSLEALNGLKPAFQEGGSVTAGNSSPLSDGASLCLLASLEGCNQFELRARARILDATVVGVDPCLMGMGPVPAVKSLLQRQRLNVMDIDVFEINEAFASQVLACQRELEIPEDRLNPCGGAIALGHPLGCTGTRLITTLLSHMERRDLGLGVVSMCIGHGQGMAVLIERM
jgi:acetyl-CoA acyltransferase